MTSKTFAEILSDALDAHGVSPGRAAQNLRRDGYHINRGTLDRWRKGAHNPDITRMRDVITRLPRALGMTPAEEAEFIRAAGEAIGLDLRPSRGRPRSATVIPQRIHFGADMLPPFAGRDRELAALQRQVIAKRSVLITGPAGVGKTRLAQELLRSGVGYFAHGCEFLAVAPEQTGDQILRNVAQLLNIEISPGQSTAGRRNAILRHIREQLHGIDLLFLLDNVERAEQVRDLVDGLPAITWVFTARRGSLKRNDVHSLQLKLPAPEEAVAIFQAHIMEQMAAGAALDAELAAEAVEMAGRLPIAIRLLSGLVSNRVISTPAELQAWMERGGLLRSGVHARKMRRFFDQVLASVPAESRLVLEACGIFATRHIQTTNLIGVCERAGIQSLDKALGELVEFSLIDMSDDGSRLELHSLLHDYARERLQAGPRHETIQEAFKDHYAGVARAISEADAGLGRDYRRLVPMEPNLLRAANAFHETGDWVRLRAIWPTLSGYLWTVSNYAAYQTLDRQCLDAARATRDVDWEAVLLSELGFVAMEMGRYDEAEDCFRRSQALYEAAGHAMLRARLRRYRASLAMKRGALDEAAGLLDECHRLLATLDEAAVPNLKLAFLLYQSACMSVRFQQGDLEAAERAGLAAERLLTDMDLGTGHRVDEFRLELGDVQYRLGKLDDARHTWERLLATTDATMHVPEHAEAQLRLAWLLASDDAPAARQLALRLAGDARQTFMRHGRFQRHDVAEQLLASLEDGSPPPDPAVLFDELRYPAY